MSDPGAPGAGDRPPDYGQAPPPAYGQQPGQGQYPPGYGQVPPPGYQYPPPGYTTSPGYTPPPGYATPPAGYGQYPPPPYGRPQINRHVGWFVVSWLFLWPLALYSLLSAFLNIDRALAVGDVAGAQYQAERVRKHGIIALAVGVAWLVIVFALFVAVGTSAGSAHVCVGTSNC